jgi:hypothetical protein
VRQPAILDSPVTKTTAADLQRMLADRHLEDVFVPECKDGPSQTRSHLRLDAWVLLKTWSPITTIGYEIKVDRADWRRDEKMHNYMPLCHLLYVVAPKGLVPIEELPSGVGLMEPVGTAGRLQIKRKAARRDILLPAELMVYVLMCRTRITRERTDYDPSDRSWRVKELQEWIAGKESRTALSYAVSQKIREAFDKQEQQLRRERERNDELQRVKERIAELGFDVNQPVSAWAVKDKLNALNRTVSQNTLWDLRQSARKLAQIADDLERLKKGITDTEEEAVTGGGDVTNGEIQKAG